MVYLLSMILLYYEFAVLSSNINKKSAQKARFYLTFWAFFFFTYLTQYATR
nr:MAG TPA: hypothetical protein [Caudoviricetes sp.]